MKIAHIQHQKQLFDKIRWFSLILTIDQLWQPWKSSWYFGANGWFHQMKLSEGFNSREFQSWLGWHDLENSWPPTSGSCRSWEREQSSAGLHIAPWPLTQSKAWPLSLVDVGSSSDPVSLPEMEQHDIALIIHHLPNYHRLHEFGAHHSLYFWGVHREPPVVHAVHFLSLAKGIHDECHEYCTSFVCRIGSCHINIIHRSEKEMKNC